MSGNTSYLHLLQTERHKERKKERKKEGVKEEVTYRDTSYLKMAFLMANFDVGADAYLENQLVKIII